MVTGPRDAVLLFAKAPNPGEVKTRLVPPLTKSEAARLAGAFIADLTARLATLEARLVLAMSPEATEDDFDGLVPGDWARVTQGHGDLGRKLAQATTAEFEQGCGVVAVIGADHPDLPLARIVAALDAARAGRVGWVTTLDGGYACLALPRALPAIFEAVPWSTPRVAEATRNNARRSGVLLEDFGPWYDLDTPEDVERFLASDGASRECPATWQALASLRPRWEERRRS